MFKINLIGDYHDVYLKTDVLLLPDVSERFRKTCMKYKKLDPCTKYDWCKIRIYIRH